MSLFVSFASLSGTIEIPADRGSVEDLYGEEGDFKEGVEELGIFKEGQWKSDDSLELFRGQYFALGLDEVLPDESGYQVLTSAMIEGVEAALSHAQVRDRRKREQVAGDASIPDFLRALAGREECTEDYFIRAFIATAKQALAEHPDRRILVVVN